MGSLIDLHMHTNCSDGALSPKEIIDEAAKNGVKVIAITDHDTTEAYSEDLYNYASSKNIKIINCVEISTKTKRCGIHVLGYNFDLNNQEFKDKLFALRNTRHDYLKKVAVKLNELGYIVNVEELDKIDAVTKAHIARDVINNEKNETILLRNFNHIPNMGEFIETVMNEGCPAYVRKESITPKEAAELIRRAGGKVVLAHPVAYRYEDNLNENDIAELVNEMKPDALEANYIYVDRNNRKINEVDIWNSFAKEHNLNVTVGSDFHNKNGVYVEIGFKNEELTISDETMENIIKNLCYNSTN